MSQKIKAVFVVNGTPKTRHFDAEESVIHVVGPTSERGSSLEMTFADGSRLEICSRHLEMVERYTPADNPSRWIHKEE